MDRALWRWFINRRAALNPSNFMNFFSRPENYCYYSYYDHYHYPRTSESGSPEPRPARWPDQKQQPRKNELGRRRRRRREYQSLINIINNKADEIRAQVPGWPDRGQPAHPHSPGMVSPKRLIEVKWKVSKINMFTRFSRSSSRTLFSASFAQRPYICLSFEQTKNTRP